MPAVFTAARSAVAVTLLLIVAACGSPAPPLTPAVRAAIDKEMQRHAWPAPTAVEVNAVGYLVIDFEVPPTLAIAKRRFAEERLLAIRELVLPDGFKNFRVNVNGPPPGTGLVQRYGSARLTEHGSLQWVTP